MTKKKKDATEPPRYTWPKPACVCMCTLFYLDRSINALIPVTYPNPEFFTLCSSSKPLNLQVLNALVN